MKLSEHQERRLCNTVLDVAIAQLEDKTPYTPIAAEVEDNFGRLSITLYIERRDRRITIDECAKVSQKLEAAIEELAELQALQYTLDISSPGLFRQLKSDRELAFYVGKTVCIKPVNVVESKATQGEFPPLQLKAYSPETRTAMLLNAEGETLAQPLDALPEGEGLFLAPEIQWPNNEEESAEDEAEAAATVDFI